MIKKKMQYNKYKELNDKYERKVNKLATIRLILFIVMILTFILKHYYYKIFLSFIFVLSLITFIILIIVHDNYYKIYDYYNKYTKIIEEYIKRTNGEWKKFKDTGEEYLNDNNIYLKDLDVIGNNSLYQLLSICKTKGGQRKLVSKFSNNNLDNLENEQQAVEELSNNIKFCIDYQVYLSKFDDKNIDLTNDLKTLNINLKVKTFDMILGIVLTSISIATLILSVFKVINIKSFFLIFIINFLINYLYFYIYNKDFQKIDKILNIYGNTSDLFRIVLNTNFKTKKLMNIKNNISTNYDLINTIEKFEILNNLKNNLMSNFIFNGITNLNIFIMYYFKQFINYNLKDLEKNIDDIEDLESLISIAGLAFIKENICMPTKINKIEINFNNIHHPLLEEKKCVTNDFKTKNGVNIITGSNMGGKTSFLRTIGINIILMNAGSYVCATNFTSNYFNIFTSMRINDDIEKGISTFYGELLRIKEMMDYLNKGNMLVLIDEIFKGTNYQDRIFGASEVIKKLNNKNIITFLTTHDFELCDMDNIKNYHVKEYYEDNKICFDYKIREGKCNSTNAKYLMKKLNIID